SSVHKTRVFQSFGKPESQEMGALLLMRSQRGQYSSNTRRFRRFVGREVENATRKFSASQVWGPEHMPTLPTLGWFIHCEEQPLDRFGESGAGGERIEGHRSYTGRAAVAVNCVRRYGRNRTGRQANSG
ncbi:MAG: hypothetical protein ACK55A_02830, partial [Gemmatimonas sp.]